MSGGYEVDCGALRSAALGLQESVVDLHGIFKTIGSSQCDIPRLAFTEWNLNGSPSATSAYARVRGDAETVLGQMTTHLGDLAEELYIVAQRYQHAEAANTAAASSAHDPNGRGLASQEKNLAATAPGGGVETALQGVVAGTVEDLRLHHPPHVERITHVAEALQSTLSQERWRALFDLALDGPQKAQKIYADIDELITRASRYLIAWVTAPSAVRQAAEEWGNQASRLQQVHTHCQEQVRHVREHWSGTAADDFDSYAKDLLDAINSAPAAFSNVNSDLGDLAKSLGNMNESIIFKGADTVVDSIQSVADVTRAVVDDLPDVGVSAPYAVVKIVTDVVDTMIGGLSKALRDLDDLVTQVGKIMNDIVKTSGTMQFRISSAVDVPSK